MKTEKLYIIDALGPFSVNEAGGETINWSKVHFSQLESGGRLPYSVRRRVIERFERYIQRVAALGYNSVSIDDLAHLAAMPFYNPALQNLLNDYRRLYKKLFAIARHHRMKIFVNTDYFFSNEDIQRYMHHTKTTPLDVYRSALERALQDFPEIEGVIMRLGESDGKDVQGVFLSQLTLRTPGQVHELLVAVLPLFERRNKRLIVRTWTVGVYEIGDLIWNEQTYNVAFSSIHSEALIISMKFGDTDFMRYLQLNPLFFHGQHKKLIELQTRREWEGMGTFPSFVGWDYAAYLKQLKNSQTLAGIQVWCQTGGWAKSAWTNVTYLNDSSFWNELNTEVTIDIARYSLSVGKAVQRFCDTRRIAHTDTFIELLRLADEAIKKGLYVPELAARTLYFRRTRIPPLTWITWDKVLLSAPVIYLHRLLLSSVPAAIRQADEAAAAAEKMLALAQEISLPEKVIRSLEFEQATLLLFAQLRRYMLDGLPVEELAQLHVRITAYERRYPQHYSIPRPIVPRKRRWPRFLLPALLRPLPAYRMWDRVMLKTSPLQLKLVRFFLRRSKSRLADQSMGFEVFFK